MIGNVFKINFYKPQLKLKAEYISAESTMFSDAIVVTTAQLAKELEFDRLMFPSSINLIIRGR